MARFRTRTRDVQVSRISDGIFGPDHDGKYVVLDGPETAVLTAEQVVERFRPTKEAAAQELWQDLQSTNPHLFSAG